jgi:hypothetical protein
MMGTERTTMASLALILSYAAVAFAQIETPPEGRIPVATGLSVTPAVYYFAGYDTDLIRTQGGRPGQENYVAPQIEGWLDRGRIHASFVNALSYQTGGGTSSWNHFNSAQFHSDGGLFRVRGLVSNRNHYAPPTDFVGFELGIRSRRIENTFEGEFGLAPIGHRLRASVTAKRAALRYNADQRFEESSLHFNLNRDNTIVSTQGGWVVSPLTSVTAEVDVSRDKFLYVPGQNGRGTAMMLGVETKPLGMMTAIAQWGQLSYTDLNGHSATVPTFSGVVALSRGQSLLTVNASRNITFSFNAGTGFYVQSGLDSYLSLKVGQSLEPYIREQWRLLKPQGALASEGAFTGAQRLKGGLAFRIGQLRIGPEVERYTYSGPGAFAGWRGVVFMVFGSDRIVRMDRPVADEW